MLVLVAARAVVTLRFMVFCSDRVARPLPAIKKISRTEVRKNSRSIGMHRSRLENWIVVFVHMQAADAQASRSDEYPNANVPRYACLELLPRKDRLSLLAVCEPVQLVLAGALCEPGTRTRHVYFPPDGFISLIARLDGHRRLEVGMVGREGMLGAQVALGVMLPRLHTRRAPLRCHDRRGGPAAQGTDRVPPRRTHRAGSAWTRRCCVQCSCYASDRAAYAGLIG
jgi:hypothetical protein